MKTIKFLGLPLLFIMYLMITLPFQSCKPDDEDCNSSTADKPNIYIYPNEKIQLTVKLDFPMGGKIVKSIPEYGTGWNVLVDTTGLMDNTYSYLFYESIQPDIWQRNYGWSIETDDLDLFFRNNLTEYGFKGGEIEDFVDYWIPRLKYSPYYLIYPQTKNLIDNVIKFDFSQQPDNLLRLFYLIKGSNQLQESLIEPKIDNFKREGYVVTEWGVILK